MSGSPNASIHAYNASVALSIILHVIHCWFYSFPMVNLNMDFIFLKMMFGTWWMLPSSNIKHFLFVDIAYPPSLYCFFWNAKYMCAETSLSILLVD